MDDRRPGMLGILLIACVGLSGCGAIPSPQASATNASAAAGAAPPVPGAPATWQLVDPGRVSSDSTTLEVEVTRLDCANGVTGELLAPVITYEADRVTIRIDAEPSQLGAANCQGNNAVPVVVELSEPLADRTLVDGACITTDARRTAACVTAERSWSAP